MTDDREIIAGLPRFKRDHVTSGDFTARGVLTRVRFDCGCVYERVHVVAFPKHSGSIVVSCAKHKGDVDRDAVKAAGEKIAQGVGR